MRRSLFIALAARKKFRSKAPGNRMRRTERVVENLNHALHTLFAEDEHVYLLGEDILDPYGGAFKVTKGLSTAYPKRVLTTPISEEAILGVAGGLALCGEKAIVEIMFGDFIALGFDQIVNFAAKSVTMYGHRVEIPLVIRCPVGGNRGYGPTHSQSLQKHFIGVPNLSLFEVSPFHNNVEVFNCLVKLGHPCILFEDKILYTQQMYHDGMIDDLFHFDFSRQHPSLVRVSLNCSTDYSCVCIVPGGMVARSLAAAKRLFIDWEIETLILVPSQLYPFAYDAVLPYLKGAEHLFIIEEGIAGGTWGSELACEIYKRLWGQLSHPIQLIHSKESIIPASSHLEKRVLVQEEDIYKRVKETIIDA